MALESDNKICFKFVSQCSKTSETQEKIRDVKMRAVYYLSGDNDENAIILDRQFIRERKKYLIHAPERTFVDVLRVAHLLTSVLRTPSLEPLLSLKFYTGRKKYAGR